jgi:tungstate transport system ATP-binding protein
MTSLLAVQNLVVERGDRRVLDVEHLTIEEGEVMAVIGPNGAGKSTLLLALARLLKPDGGKVIFHGQPLEEQDELAYHRRIGLVMQESLLLDTSVFNNVAAGLRFRNLPKADISRRVDEWLIRLGIAHLRDRPARKLSGGEAQRASLARAFALQPEVLFLDEPFGALDAPTRARLLEDLQSLLKATNITTIFITHDLDEALLLGDQVAVLIEGRLRQVGKPEQVFTAPADADVASFVGVETVVNGKIITSRDGQVIVEAHDIQLQAVSDLLVGRSVFFCLRPEDVTLWSPGSSPASSARNRLSGHIRSMTPQGPLVRVSVEVGFPLMALITRASAREMGLLEGQEVTATFKASAVHLIPR